MDNTTTTQLVEDPELRRALMARVQSAIYALRRGELVRVVAGDGAYLCLATEQVNSGNLERLRQLGTSDPFMAITTNRAAVLHIAPTGEKSVCLPLHDMKLRAIRDLADPTKDLTNPFRGPHPRLETTTSTAIDGAIKLCKVAQLLPSVLAVKATPEDTHESILTLQPNDPDLFEIVSSVSLKQVSTARVPLHGAENTQVIAYRPEDGGVEHLAIVIGDLDVDSPVLIRLHSECFTGDLLGSMKCDCGEQLRGAIEQIGHVGSGVLLYLSQEGRGIGLMNKMRAYYLQDEGFDTIEANERLGFEADERVFLPAAEILRQLGISRVHLMTNNPDKVAQLAEQGINVERRVAHEFPSNAHNEMYLATKARRSGHYLTANNYIAASQVGIANPPDEDL
ncbi:MAG: GTP cyclohydrolase II [Alphaproteobacteria bacterium]|nr:MAG: GTP cyclohydrolase II [Alphaproteobacteria bacterium]